jgi:hypothetical protein
MEGLAPAGLSTPLHVPDFWLQSNHKAGTRRTVPPRFTFRTLLVKEDRLADAVAALERAGHAVS